MRGFAYECVHANVSINMLTQMTLFRLICTSVCVCVCLRLDFVIKSISWILFLSLKSKVLDKKQEPQRVRRARKHTYYMNERGRGEEIEG